MQKQTEKCWYNRSNNVEWVTLPKYLFHVTKIEKFIYSNRTISTFYVWCQIANFIAKNKKNCWKESKIASSLV